MFSLYSFPISLPHSLPILAVQLLKPPPVRLVTANQHTLWVEWDRVRWDADDTRLNPRATPVTYYLYVRIGYQGLLVGDRYATRAVITCRDHAPKKYIHVVCHMP